MAGAGRAPLQRLGEEVLRQAPLQMQLYTISFSHFCDAARWALSLHTPEVSVSERAALPVMHMLALPSLKSGKSTPYACFRRQGEERDTVLEDSWAISDFCAQESGLAPVSLELRQALDKVGVASRALAYDKLLPDPAFETTMVAACAPHLPAWERAMWFVTGGLAKRLVARGLVRSPVYIEKKRVELERLRVALEPLLPGEYAAAATPPAQAAPDPSTAAADGDSAVSSPSSASPIVFTASVADELKPLADGRPSLASLALCALWAPVVMPPGYARGAAELPPEQEKDLPAAYLALVQHWRTTPLGRYVLDTYRQYR